jgi:ABC-type transporter Mla subunit MlaD
MFKRIVLALVAVAFVATAAFAAPVAAKVSAVDGDKVTVALQADKPAWMKVGAPVKIKNVGPGKVAAIDGTSVTITTKKAGDLKAGQDVSIDKGGMAGC